MRPPALLNQIQDDAALGAASRQSRSKALLDAIEGLRVLLADKGSIAIAARWDQDNGSTRAMLDLSRCREYVETIASNAHADLSAASADKVRRVVGNSGGET